MQNTSCAVNALNRNAQSHGRRSGSDFDAPTADSIGQTTPRVCHHTVLFQHKLAYLYCREQNSFLPAPQEQELVRNGGAMLNQARRPASNSPQVKDGPWFILHVHSKREKAVASHLEGRGVEYYLPTYKETRIRCDRRVILELPLFPGYFFTRFARAQRQAVITVPGIHHILEVPGGFATVSEAEIRNLRDGLLSRLPILPSLTVATGDEVTIARGPFRGYEGFLSEVRNQSVRVIMSVGDIKACSFSLDLALSDIQPIGCGWNSKHIVLHEPASSSSLAFRTKPLGCLRRNDLPHRFQL
jgi:transcription antitermination factor NusG